MVTLLILAFAAALPAAGCAACTGSKAPAVAEPTTTPRPTVTNRPSASSKPAHAWTVQQLAAAMGCQAAPTVEGADFRQATCTAAGAQFVLLDFDTAKGQRDWLDYAKPYGGVYLVGDRWVLSGESKEYLQTLQATLGGTIEEDSTHGSVPGSGGRK